MNTTHTLSAKSISILFMLYLGWFIPPVSYAQVDQSAVDDFVRISAYQQKRPLKDIAYIIDQAEFQPVIIEKMSRPAEKTMTWERYRNIFMTSERIHAGVVFWKENEQALNRVSEETGVAIETILGVIGVETYFGARMGTYRVLDALYTLAFGYPKRSSFFKKELGKYLELCKKEGLDPLVVKGSYAGAIGYGQFMPSSYLAYAKSYDSDSGADLINQVEDGIASVANYLKVHRWNKGELVAMPANKSEHAETLSKQSVKPANTIIFYTQKGYEPAEPVSPSKLVSLQVMDMEDGSQEYWVTFKNFYVITRYNHSPLYALAVFQLGEAIKEARKTDG
ncbi:lytic murein transglycosylase B [Reichenbachiella carrageenanivorans]|uniref:Lytic murein transglycosylase B n=1 Tax=Reichenbachiella carrageenanivorans TaxID=2979869 RepID=A0ABY6CXX9_9BACT|nr:lytic murein transglycosylase B [Reichenbachiella carrageenanivorans]UXX78579.1 lytic murein transglycosylase B [Reichenbachiella carrageenanivorans]